MLLIFFTGQNDSRTPSDNQPMDIIKKLYGDLLNSPRRPRFHDCKVEGDEAASRTWKNLQ